MSLLPTPLKNDGWQTPTAQDVLGIAKRYGTKGSANNLGSFPAVNALTNTQVQQFNPDGVAGMVPVQQPAAPPATGDAWQRGDLQPAADWAQQNAISPAPGAAERWSSPQNQTQRFMDRKLGQRSSDPVVRMQSSLIDGAARTSDSNYTPAPVIFKNDASNTPQGHSNWSPYTD